ncbi:MAG: ankyrin repeat domain-containing protein [Rickettsiales bacterium]
MQNTLRLVTILAWGLWIPAYAQAPTFSLPPIPGSGGAVSTPAGSKPPTSPKAPSAEAPPPLAIPGNEALTAPPEQPEERSADATEDIPEAQEQEEAASDTPADQPLDDAPAETPYAVEPPPLTIGPVASAEESVNAPPPLALPLPPTGASLEATAIPASKPAKPKRTRPTWEDVLKPSYEPVETTFNFRRQVLPPTIYRDAYTNENRHLPVARDGQHYDNIFLLAVARNDVNAVRAMLANGRRDVNLTNAEGDSALIVALRHGALQTARLLLARGADPTMRGAGGLSPYDYAYYWGDTDLMQALRG